MATRLQVLAAVVLGLPCAVLAQPPDAPGDTSTAQVEGRLPLLPLKLADFLASHKADSRLTLKMDNVTPAEIAQEVKRQTGIEIVPDLSLLGEGEKAPRYSVEAKDQTFWQAIRAWNREQNGPRVVRDYGANRFRMFHGQVSDPGMGFPIGPCLLVVSAMQQGEMRMIQLREAGPGEPPALTRSDYSSLSFQSRVLIDPRLQPFVSAVVADVEAATYDQGRPLKVRSRDAYNSVHGIGNGEFDAGLAFDLPPQNARRISTLRGVLRLAVITRSQKWELDLATTPKASQRFDSEGGGAIVHFEGLEPSGEGWSAKFLDSRLPGAPGPQRFLGGKDSTVTAASLSSNSLPHAVTILNSRGERLPASGYSRGPGEGGASKWDISLRRRRDQHGDFEPEEVGAPAKIIIDLPLEWREVQIPFEIKDLPLP